MEEKQTEVAQSHEDTYTEEEHSEDQTAEHYHAETIDASEQKAVDDSSDSEPISESESKVEYIEKSLYDELQQQADEFQKRYLRAQADLENFRRRTRLEKEEAAKYASLPLIEQLLPVVDNFERAIAASQTNSDFDSLAKGVDMVFRQMSKALEEVGLQTVEAVGEPFNPEFHQAVMQVESDEHDEGIIVEELQKGYKLKDKIIRPSMVKVSK